MVFQDDFADAFVYGGESATEQDETSTNLLPASGTLLCPIMLCSVRMCACVVYVCGGRVDTSAVPTDL